MRVRGEGVRVRSDGEEGEGVRVRSEGVGV